MKAGTLVYHPKYGKGLVLKRRKRGSGGALKWQVLWNKPKTLLNGAKLRTLTISQQELTILSEPEQ